MADDETAGPPEVKLGKFERKQILATRLVVRRTGDGLSNAMEIEPAIYHHDEVVGVYIEGRVSDIGHPNIKDTNGVARVHIVLAESALVIPAEEREAFKVRIKEQELAVQLKREKEAGIGALIDEEGNAIPPDAQGA
jgi:hypothetical protein